jgi:hypothetical protein
LTKFLDMKVLSRFRDSGTPKFTTMFFILSDTAPQKEMYFTRASCPILQPTLHASSCKPHKAPKHIMCNVTADCAVKPTWSFEALMEIAAQQEGAARGNNARSTSKRRIVRVCPVQPHPRPTKCPEKIWPERPARH